MKKKNSLASRLFGGVFFIAGIVMLYLAVISPIFDAIQMQFWQQNKAQLLQAEVTSFQSRNDNGSYTTMYRVEISYQYVIASQNYFGHRAKIHNNTSSSDSDEAYELLSRVKNEQARQQFITIWYNQNSPNEAIYDRSLDFKFIVIMTMFSAVFMMIGIGIILYSRGDKAEQISLANVNTEKLWTTRPQWCSATIFSQAESKTNVAWFIAILALLFFGMFALMLIGRHPIASLMAVLLLIGPVWLVFRAKRIQKEWQFYQKVPLTLNPYPGVVGGKVQGCLVIPKAVASEQYVITLVCTKYWTSRSGGKSESNQSIVFSKQQTPLTRVNAQGNLLSFDFSVPAEKPESSEPSNSYHTWTIKVKTKQAGLGKVSTGILFDRNYEIPVFITHESQTIEQELVATPLTGQEKFAIKERLDINASSQVLSLHTPGSTNSLVFAGIGSLFFIIGIVIAAVGQSFFGIVFSAMSAIFIFLGLWGWARNCKINISPNSFDVDVYWRSKLMKQHVFTTSDIKEISAFKSSSSHTHGQQASEMYCLRLYTKYGNKIDLGGEFTSMKNAIHMKNEIEQVLNA